MPHKYSIEQVYRYGPKTSESEFEKIIKYFESTAEYVLFDQNEDRKSKLKEMLQRISTLEKIETNAKNSVKRPVEETVIVGPPDAKKRKIETFELPNEIWLKILKYLDTKDVFQSFALVCKNFNQLTKTPTALNYLQIEKNIYESKHYHQLIKVVKRSKNLTCIKIEGDYSNYIKHIVNNGFKFCPRLKSLLIHTSKPHYNSLSLTPKCVEILVENSHKLENLELKRVEFKTNEDFAKLSELTNLKSLLVSKAFHNWNKRKVEPIAKNCSKLEKVRFDYVDARNDKSDLHGFFSNIKNSLKSLTIDKVAGYGISKKDTFLKNVALCKKLEEIKFPDARFLTDFGLDVISQLPKLKNLELNNLGEIHYCDLNTFFMMFNAL